MHLHAPCTVLVPDTFLSVVDGAFVSGGKRSSSTSMLVEYIREEFPGVALEPVGRKYWNDSAGILFLFCVDNAHITIYRAFKGLEFVMQLSVNDEERAGTVLAVSNKSEGTDVLSCSH